jgi:hypothetical protein
LRDLRNIAFFGAGSHIRRRGEKAMALWTIRAEYDPEAKVWYSVDGDVPGLAADAETVEALAAKAGSMLPDLLEIHEAEIVERGRLKGPHRIRIIAHHEHEFPVAA